MFKTFEDFVKLASRRYHLPFEVAEKIIDKKLKEQNLDRNAVICYINWAGLECLTQMQIAKKLDVVRETVKYHLTQLKKVWPHLFNFGPKIPRFDTRRSDRKKSGGTMGRLRKNVPTNAVKF